MAFNPNDSLLKLLMALGLADANGNPVNKTYIDPVSVTSGAVQSTVYTLSTVTLPALALGPGRGLRIRASLTLAANANAKDLAVKLGATSLCTVTGNTGNAVDVIFDIEVIRVSANVQQAWAQCLVNGALVAAASIQFEAAETESSALAVTVTSANTAAAAASATSKGLTVQVLG